MEMRGATRKLSKWVTSRAHPKREPAGFALCLGSRQDLSLSGNGAIGPVPHLPSPQRYGANLNRALIAGTAYFLALFALGFALGAIRVTFIAPRFGQLAATCVEVPLMLTAAFFLCHWAIQRWQVPRTPAIRWAMALWFLALLLIFETLLGVTLFARTLAEQWAALATSAGLLGLCAQTVGALLPVFVGKGERQ